MELFLYYVVPNVVMFSGIYLFSKALEHQVWYVIENYEKIRDMAKL
jgi:hypothetical protein